MLKKQKQKAQQKGLRVSVFSFWKGKKKRNKKKGGASGHVAHVHASVPLRLVAVEKSSFDFPEVKSKDEDLKAESQNEPPKKEEVGNPT